MVRTVFDMNPQGLAVLDEDRSVVIANDAFAAAVGVDPEELEGKPFSELPVAEERESLQKELEQAHEEGEEFRAGPVSFLDGGGAGYTVTGQLVRGTPELPYRILLRLEAAGDE
jgi:PAS domain S-box-containing protein